jgi:hypothetical protein
MPRDRRAFPSSPSVCCLRVCASGVALTSLNRPLPGDEEDDRRHARKRDRGDDRNRRHHRGDKKEKKVKKEHKRERSHRRHGSDGEEETTKRLPAGARPISEADYFLRATEFRVWLARSKCVDGSEVEYACVHVRVAVG